MNVQAIIMLSSEVRNDGINVCVFLYVVRLSVLILVAFKKTFARSATTVVKQNRL